MVYNKKYGHLRNYYLNFCRWSKKFIIQHLPKLSNYIISKRKGVCHCKNHNDDNPFPLDLSLFGHPKYKQCGYYYLFRVRF